VGREQLETYEEMVATLDRHSRQCHQVTGAAAGIKEADKCGACGMNVVKPKGPAVQIGQGSGA
jgi:nitrous oxide reductase accessory protein NosL